MKVLDLLNGVSVGAAVRGGLYLCRGTCGEVFELSLECLHLDRLRTDHIAQRANHHGGLCAGAYKIVRGICPTHPTMTKTKRPTRRWGPRSTHAVPYLVDPSPKSVEHDQSVLSVQSLNTRTTRGTKFTVIRFPEIDNGPVEPDLPFFLSCILVRARTDADVHDDMTIDSSVTDLNRSSSWKRVI